MLLLLSTQVLSRWIIVTCKYSKKNQIELAPETPHQPKANCRVTC
jgi:hypothetical protein